MAKTTIGGAQITDGSVQRADLDTTTAGKAVVAKIVQGTGNISISSTGADSGTGDVTINLGNIPESQVTNLTTDLAAKASSTDAFIYALIFG